MIITVRLDGVDSYFYDSTNGEIIRKYDPDNKDLKVALTLRDNSKLIFDNDSINQIYGGQIIIQNKDDRYIIDDGYRDTLVKTGYIIYKNYDKDNEFDKDKGLQIQNNIISSIDDIMKKIPSAKYTRSDNDELLLTAIDNKSNYEYKIRVNKVEDIVTKNLHRKDNSLSFYPFDKQMDKFGTVYVSIFAKYLGEDFSIKNDKIIYADTFVKDMIVKLGVDYHFISLPIKGQILYYEGL